MVSIFRRFPVPVWFGKSKSTVVFALPGNPLSCQVNFVLFVAPFLNASYGIENKKPIKIPIAISKMKKGTLDVFYPSKIIQKNDGLSVMPLPFNGSGDIRATKDSDGIVLHEASTLKLNEGDLVFFYPWVSAI